MAKMTELELDAAINWFKNRSMPMPGARKMYRLAHAAIKALRVDQERLDGLDREGLIAVIHYLRAANINRGSLIDQLEDENYDLRRRMDGGADHE